MKIFSICVGLALLFTSVQSNSSIDHPTNQKPKILSMVEMNVYSITPITYQNCSSGKDRRNCPTRPH